jgi:hypothetical protein
MRRSTLNFIVDTGGLLAMLSLLATGSLMAFVLPPRSGRLELWGWNRHDIGDLHFWIAVGLLGMLTLHIALHWTWVCTLVRRWLGKPGGYVAVQRLATRITAGVALFTVIAAGIGALVWLGALDVSRRVTRQEPGAPRAAPAARSSDAAEASPESFDQDAEQPGAGGAGERRRRRGDRE